MRGERDGEDLCWAVRMGQLTCAKPILCVAEMQVRLELQGCVGDIRSVNVCQCRLHSTAMIILGVS